MYNSLMESYQELTELLESEGLSEQLPAESSEEGVVYMMTQTVSAENAIQGYSTPVELIKGLRDVTEDLDLSDSVETEISEAYSEHVEKYDSLRDEFYTDSEIDRKKLLELATNGEVIDGEFRPEIQKLTEDIRSDTEDAYSRSEALKTQVSEDLSEHSNLEETYQRLVDEKENLREQLGNLEQIIEEYEEINDRTYREILSNIQVARENTSHTAELIRENTEILRRRKAKSAENRK